MTDLLHAMRQRRATRAFTDRPVDDALVRTILEAARWAPSGTNTQPWRVAVLSGTTRQRFTDMIIGLKEQGIEPTPDYAYYPAEWPEPYKGRRAQVGKALYKALGIGREDRAAQKQAWYNNYRFFGAPVGLLLFMDRCMGRGSYIDMGMFWDNLLLAAEVMGLATCPQASLGDYPQAVREMLGFDENWLLLGGLSLGYADETAPANDFDRVREEVDAFTQWFR